MKVELNDKDEQIISAKMRAGKYRNPAEVVSAALGVFRITPESKAELIAMIDEGAESLDRGEGKPWDTEKFLDRVHKKHPGAR